MYVKVVYRGRIVISALFYIILFPFPVIPDLIGDLLGGPMCFQKDPRVKPKDDGKKVQGGHFYNRG